MNIWISFNEGVKGDALRARRDIPAFTIVAFYSGTRVSDMTKIFYPNMTIDERENAHKNLLSFDRVRKKMFF